MRRPTRILPVRTASDLDAVVTLFRAYAASLAIDLSYQDFDAEMAAMPGKYAPPEGELLLAAGPEGLSVGCVALRRGPHAEACEMKRLYVAPEGRGMGVGRALVAAVVRVAARVGYAEIVLDTLPSMHRAQALYASLGFEAIAPYYDTPIAGTVFMRRILRPGNFG